ncbi:MAG: porin [Candidatus Omnitrophica bacterium]|nr:porin [Candidatus Omnitrophota bacterium]
MRKFESVVRGIFLSILLVSVSGVSWADVSASSGKSIDQRIEELEQEVQLLKRQREVDREVQAKKDLETPVVKVSQDGIGLQSQDQNFTMKFHGLVQADGRYYANDNTSAGSNTYLIRRLRPYIDGTVYKYFDYRLVTDFGNNATVLQDAFIDFKYWKQASLKFGKFKSPIGIERLQSDASMMFMEFALSTNLVPNRDIGIDLHGELFDGVLNYDAGIFNGALDGANGDANDAHDDKEAAGRIFLQPFKNTTYDSLSGLGLGLGGSYGTAHGTTNTIPTYKSDGQQNIFTYAPASGSVFAHGPRYRLAPQASYYYGPLGVLSEWVLSSEQLNVGTLSKRINNNGYQIAASYVLTGENNSYSGIAPHNIFDPRNGKWGAFEIATRFSQLDIDKNVFPSFSNALTQVRAAKAWGLGLNWYLNKNVRVMTDFFQTFFQDGGAVDGAIRKNENAILTRVQFNI